MKKMIILVAVAIASLVSGVMLLPSSPGEGVASRNANESMNLFMTGTTLWNTATERHAVAGDRSHGKNATN